MIGTGVLALCACQRSHTRHLPGIALSEEWGPIMQRGTQCCPLSPVTLPSAYFCLLQIVFLVKWVLQMKLLIFNETYTSQNIKFFQKDLG